MWEDTVRSQKCWLPLVLFSDSILQNGEEEVSAVRSCLWCVSIEAPAHPPPPLHRTLPKEGAIEHDRVGISDPVPKLALQTPAYSLLAAHCAFLLGGYVPDGSFWNSALPSQF